MKLWDKTMLHHWQSPIFYQAGNFRSCHIFFREANFFDVDSAYLPLLHHPTDQSFISLETFLNCFSFRIRYFSRGHLTHSSIYLIWNTFSLPIAVRWHLFQSVFS